MIFNNEVYDILSIVSRVVLPLSAFVVALGDIWQIPLCQPIALTLVAIDTFLGAILIESKRKYDLMMKEGGTDDTSNG